MVTSAPPIATEYLSGVDDNESDQRVVYSLPDFSA